MAEYQHFDGETYITFTTIKKNSRRIERSKTSRSRHLSYSQYVD